MAQAVSMHARSSNIITVLASISVADLRSDSSQVQSPKSKVQSPKFKVQSSTTGKAHTTRLLAQTPRGSMDPLIDRTCQQSEHIPIVPKKFNSFVIKIIMQLAA